MKQLPRRTCGDSPTTQSGHNDEINSNLIRLVGADRVLLGSDYCFDMGLADPLGDVERLDTITAAGARLDRRADRHEIAAVGVAASSRYRCKAAAVRP